MNSSISYIVACASHKMKSISVEFNKLTSDENQYRFANYCFSLLINSTNLEISDEYFRCMCIVFLSPYKTKEVMKAKETLSTALNDRPETKTELDKLLKTLDFISNDGEKLNEFESVSDSDDSQSECETDSHSGK